MIWVWRNSIILENNSDNNDSDTVLDGTALDNMMVNPAVYINGDRYPEFRNNKSEVDKCTYHLRLYAKKWETD